MTHEIEAAALIIFNMLIRVPKYCNRHQMIVEHRQRHLYQPNDACVCVTLRMWQRDSFILQDSVPCHFMNQTT